MKKKEKVDIKKKKKQTIKLSCRFLCSYFQ